MSDVNVTVTVTDQPARPRWQTYLAIVVTVVLVAWMFGWLPWLAAAVGFAAVLGGIAWAVYWVQFPPTGGHHDWPEEIAAGYAQRADQQHAWFLAGDPRGTYGVGTPAMRKFWKLTNDEIPLTEVRGK